MLIREKNETINEEKGNKRKKGLKEKQNEEEREEVARREMKLCMMEMRKT